MTKVFVMKVLLLNPPFLPKFSRQSRSPCVTKGGTFYIPYFLSYCAGAVENAGFETKLVDAVANCWDRKQTVQFAKEFNPGLIVIDTSTPSIINDMQVADALKDALPDSHITLVGTHPTALPEETLKKCKADSVCRGEYDYTVRGLAAILKENKSLKTVEGLSFKDGKKIANNGKRELIKNLDELPFVSEVFLKHFGKDGIKKYFYASLRWPQTTLLTARGCPYNCLFCLTPDMPIITEKGTHSIESLVEQFNPVSGSIIPVDKNNLPKVLSHDGKFHNIEAVMKRQIESDIIELKAQGNPFKLKLTANHKIYALKKEKALSAQLEPDLIESDKLEKGDFVAVPRLTETRDIECIEVSKLVKLPNGGYERGLQISDETIKKVFEYGKKGLSTRKIAKLTGVSKSRVQTILKEGEKIFRNIPYEIFDDEKFIRCSNSKNRIPSIIKLENDFLRLCGYYLSEGHVNSSKNRPNSKSLVFTFNKNEIKYIEDVRKLIKKYFALNSRISDTNTAYQITVSSSLASDIFLSLFGTGSPEKRIPLGWLYLPKEKQLSLLSGIFSGDGYYCDKKLGFNTVSRFFAEEVQMILHRLGFATSLSITPKGKYHGEINGRRIEFKHDRYDVIVFGNKMQLELNSLMRNVFNIKLKKKEMMSNWFKSEKYIFMPIVSVNSKKYSGEVYNISVEGSHSYTINGTAVSNCNSPMKHSYRPRSIENVVAELEYIQKEMPFIKEIMFEDETFPAVKDRTIKLCDEIVKRKIRLKWSCNARVNTDLETLKAMKRAGCRLMCVGFEASEQEVLNSIDKKTTKDMQLEFMKNSRKAGILVNGCFIFGLPSDTKETMRRTLEFAKQLNCDTAQLYPLMVYPGTAAYEWAKKNNFVTTEDFSKWLTSDGQMTTTLSRPGLSRDELLAFCDLARKEYYMRAGYIVPKIFQSVRNPDEGIRTLKSAKTFLRHLK